jgi:hypothetical protein
LIIINEYGDEIVAKGYGDSIRHRIEESIKEGGVYYFEMENS